MEKRAQASETSGSGKKILRISDSSRQEIISQLILLSKVAMGCPPPKADERKLIEVAWSPILKNIPTDALQPSYEIAMEQHTDGPFGAFEICGGYVVHRQQQAEKLKQKLKLDEQMARTRRDGDIPMPPEIKQMMAISNKIMELNKSISNHMPEKDRAAIQEQIDQLKAHWSAMFTAFNAGPSAVTCNSCFNSGWSLVRLSDPISGLSNTAARPCDCAAGDKFRASYEKAVYRSMES